MRVSVVVSTYRRPRFLDLVLAGYRAQDVGDFDVVVADDGSGGDTAGVVDRAAKDGLPVVHVWHADRGFRKTEILDRAVRAAAGRYLIFSDGDCIPRPDFVRTHVTLAREGCFLSGGYVRLPAATTGALTPADVAEGRVWDRRWLETRGFRPRGRRRLRMRPPGRIPALLDRITPTSPTWNGMNASVTKEAAVAVNGFEQELGYGGEDREFGQRLENLGLRGLQVRHRAVLLHLDHDRPYLDPDTVARQRRLLDEVRREGRVTARRGIAELDDTVEWRVRRLGAGARP